jgi:hypothetical protein
MLKKTGLRLLFLAAMVSILFITQAQTEEQGWKKTLTLPSGEVVCDLNGEWASLWQGRGEYQGLGRIPNVIKITQQGNFFEGIRMIETSFFPKGSVVLTGELDKDGFKKLLFNSGALSGSYEGKISKDGNKIEFEPNKSFYFELTRK